jgi:mono/diheme cytochrome c family protein
MRTFYIVTGVWMSMLLVPVLAQDDRGALIPASRGVYTAEQAARGQEAYERYCFRCHKRDLTGSFGDDANENNKFPALIGGSFVFHWENGPISRLFSKMQIEMPPVYSEVLPDEMKLDILTYILKRNGFPSGSAELRNDRALLDTIVLTRKDEAKFEARNFALVRSVGCLTSGPNHTWMLTRAAPPAVTDQARAVGTPSNASSQTPLGTETYMLVSVNAFKPDTMIGQKVEARGLVNRTPEEKLIDVTSLETLSAVCTN